MKKIILICYLFVISQMAGFGQEQEKFEEERDERVKNSFLNSFRNPATGEVDYESVREVHSFIDKKISENTKNARVSAAMPYIEWQERGPNNYAGRIQKVMYDPNDPLKKKVWAGSNSTGLFYNNDIENVNSSWVATNMHDGPMGIIDMTFDPSNTQIFYVICVGGFYKSVDAGQTWSLKNSAYRGYDLLAVTSTEIYQATNDGLLKSIDGGTNWTTILKPSLSIGGTFVGTVSGGGNNATGIERGTDGSLYAAFGCGQIFKSSNGTVWANILAPDNPSNGASTLIALAPSTSGTSQVLYVVCGKDNNTGWFRKSIDGGVTWTPKTWTLGFLQLYDNLVIKVHPTNPNTVFAGVNNIALSLNGGDTWTGSIGGGGIADWHDIQFNPIDHSKLVVSNDQGVGFMQGSNNNSSFSGAVRYKNFLASQVHWGAMRQVANDTIFGAATQDQPSKILKGSGIGVATNLANNEGTYIKFDDDQPNLMLYTSLISVNLRLFDLSSNISTCLTCGQGQSWGWANGGVCRDYDSQSNTIYGLLGFDPNVAGRLRLRKVANISVTVSPTTNVLSDFYIDGIFANDGVSSLADYDLLSLPITIKLGKTANTMFISGYSPNSGANSGGILYKVTNFTSSTPTVTRLNPFTLPNARFASSPKCIAIGATDNQLLITLNNNYNYIETLFYTNDGGASWKTLKKMSGNNTLTGLPGKFGANYAAFNPFNYNQVILATNVGIWTCDDISLATPRWEITNAKFGKIPTNNIEIRPSDGTIMVSTYGRGIFTAKLNTCQNDVVRNDVINGGVLTIPSRTYIRGVGGNRIETNGIVNYNANTYVDLLPNFEVKKNGIFKAQIGGCN